MNFIAEAFERRLATRPDSAFLYDELTPKGVTGRRAYEISGRVYAYLKGRGIGKEDFVLIKLPRGVQPTLAMYGVWRAGAAWALVEDTYAPERIEFIRKDCGCKLVLDSEAWEAAMKTEPLNGYVDVDDHDAAYAVYTSGSTGNPKGVLHEYGNLRESYESFRYGDGMILPDDVRFACPAPLNFVAAAIIFIVSMNMLDHKVFILSYATVKNPAKLAAYMLEKRISGIFMTPSYVRAMGSRTGPFLKYLFVGSEPANGIDPGRLNIYNFYAMSESGFDICVFRIDRAYDTCPIGRPQFDKRVYILGVGEALIPLGGMYAGERNSPALRELATHAALVAAGEGVLVGLFSLLFGGLFGFGGLWIGMIAGYAAAAAYPFLFVRLAYGRDRFPWLVARDGAAVNFAIRLNRESLVAARDRIADFLCEGGVVDDDVHRVMYSVEENGLAAIEKNSGVSPCVEYFVSLAKPDFVRLIVRDDGIAMETPFRAFPEIRYLNTLNCNRTEHWFRRSEIRGDGPRWV